jgi:capsular polysaccharide biosynthesis protein
VVVSWWQRGKLRRLLAAAEIPTIRPLLRLAPPIAMRGLLEGLRWLGFFWIIGQVNEEALARSNIIYACFALFLIPSYAVSESTNSLVSNVIGQGRVGEVGAVTRRATLAAYLVTAPFAILALAAPHTVIAVFTDDQAITAGAAPSLRLLAVAMVLVVPAEVWLAAVTGTGATDIAFGIELILSLVMLACTYLAAITFELSLALVWASTGFAALVALAMSGWWLATKRVKNLDQSGSGTRRGGRLASKRSIEPLDPDEDGPCRPSLANRASEMFDGSRSSHATGTGRVYGRASVAALTASAPPAVDHRGSDVESSLALPARYGPLPSAAPSYDSQETLTGDWHAAAEGADDSHELVGSRSRRRVAMLIVVGLVIVAVFGGAAVGFSLLQPTVYAAQADFVLLPRADLSDAAADRAMTTQAMIIQSDAVLKPVAARTGMPLNKLRSEVSASIVAGSNVLRLTVGDRNRDRAVNLARLITTEYLRVAPTLSPVTGSPADRPPITPTVLSSASALEEPLRPKPLQALAAGVLLGMLAAAGAAIVLLRKRRKQQAGTGWEMTWRSPSPEREGTTTSTTKDRQTIGKKGSEWREDRRNSVQSG